MNKKFKTTAVLSENKQYYNNIGIVKNFAEMWGCSKEDIIEIEMKVSDDQSEPKWDKQEYWGWLPIDSDKFEMIYPEYKMFFICFPYGVKAAEESGQGKSYRLEVVL